MKHYIKPVAKPIVVEAAMLCTSNVGTGSSYNSGTNAYIGSGTDGDKGQNGFNIWDKDPD